METDQGIGRLRVEWAQKTGRQWAGLFSIALRPVLELNDTKLMSFLLFQSRIGLKPLAALCRRLAISTGAGIDERKTWRKESETGPLVQRNQLAQVADALNDGDTVSEAIGRTGEFFPPLFRELVSVGEETGSLTGVYQRLADHYDHWLRLQRIFLASIAWPMLQLVIAVGVIGLLILVVGALGIKDFPMTFGLSGVSGFVIYMLLVAALAGGVALLIVAIRRGKLWTRPVQMFVMRLPAVGSHLQTFALARICWVLNLTLNVALDVRRAVRLALESSGTDYFRSHADQVEQSLNDGEPIYKSLSATDAFPDDFIVALENGETGGRTTEQLEHMSRQYEERAQSALKALAVVGGFVIWGLVAAVLIVMIFRGFMFYVNTINEAANF